MRLGTLGLERFGHFHDLSIPLSPGLTVLAGPNESGKSTALHALADLLWGVPYRHHLFDLVPRSQVRISASVTTSDASQPGRLVRTGRGLFLGDGLHVATNPWGSDGEEHRSRWLDRFGLSHLALRRGGQEVCDGTGDLAELVFVARQGEWIRELLSGIEQEADVLFKDDGRSKNVKIRTTWHAYQMNVVHRGVGAGRFGV